MFLAICMHVQIYEHNFQILGNAPKKSLLFSLYAENRKFSFYCIEVERANLFNIFGNKNPSCDCFRSNQTP